MTDEVRNFMSQQKQRKQLILTTRRNIFTYRFQPIQRLQPNFMIDSRRSFMHTKYNGDNPKVRTFSLILQRQHIQPNFMTDSIRSFIHTKQSNAQTSPNNQNMDIIAGFTINIKFELLQLRQRKFCSIHIQTSQ